MNEYRFGDLKIGQTESFEVQITKEMEDRFRELTGDVNPLHRDDSFARETGDGKFKGHIAFGMLTASFYSTLAGVYLPGKNSLIHSLDIKFQKPVYAGDRLSVRGEVADKQDGLKLIRVKAVIRNQNNESVSRAEIKILVMEQQCRDGILGNSPGTQN